MKGKCTAIIQARMGSTRLPGKVMMEVLQRPLLAYVVERIRQAKRLDQVVIATTEKEEDHCIAAYCKTQQIPYFCGDSEDVMTRYLGAAQAFEADPIVRITADNPLIDPLLIDQVIAFFMEAKGHYDYVSNCLERTFPRGMEVEVFTWESFMRMAKEVTSPEEREHVTLHYYRHPELYCLGGVKGKKDLSQLRLTVDTKEDFALISEILHYFYPKKGNFSLKEIVAVLEEHPEWKCLNANIVQKPL